MTERSIAEGHSKNMPVVSPVPHLPTSAASAQTEAPASQRFLSGPRPPLPTLPVPPSRQLRVPNFQFPGLQKATFITSRDGTVDQTQ